MSTEPPVKEPTVAPAPVVPPAAESPGVDIGTQGLSTEKDERKDMFARRRLHPNQVNVKLNSQRGVEQFLDIGTSAGARRTGRSWRVSELRLKSFDDLHKLWFILLKERNVLLTEKAWCKTNSRHWTNGESNLFKVKTSMQRVKGVVAERIRAVKSLRVQQSLKDEAEGRAEDEDIGTVDKEWPETSKSGTPFDI